MWFITEFCCWLSSVFKSIYQNAIFQTRSFKCNKYMQNAYRFFPNLSKMAIAWKKQDNFPKNITSFQLIITRPAYPVFVTAIIEGEYDNTITALLHCGPVTSCGDTDLVQHSDNGLLPDGIKPLTELMLTLQVFCGISLRAIIQEVSVIHNTFLKAKYLKLVLATMR